MQIKHIETGATYTQITNEAGVAIFNELKPGAYEIVELKAPTGYACDGDVEFTISGINTDKTYNTIILNTPNRFVISKISESGSETLPGAVFKVWKGDDTSTAKEYTTDNRQNRCLY